MSAICECVCGCRVIAGNPDVTPYLCSVCSLKEMRGDGEFHHLKRNPLPPTAEQTSIARFNALADELRKLGKELKATGDALADAMSHNFDDLQAEFSAKLDRIEGAVFDSHNSHKCDHESLMMVLGSFENRLIEHLSHASQMEIATRESLDRIFNMIGQRDDKGKNSRQKPRAVAKNKAAPLVGKKGTGRKG